MNFLINFLALCGVQQIYGTPVSVVKNKPLADRTVAQKYAELKRILIFDLGYSTEFADLVEVNLKRAIKEENERRNGTGSVLPDVNPTVIDLRQQEEDYYDETTRAAGTTTPGVTPIDILRGVAMIFTSLRENNENNFWSGFVNFFPAGQRDNALALINASLGRRPASWPTLPSTTTPKMTTKNTKDEDELLDSEESTTKAAAVTATTGASVATATVASDTSAATVTSTPTIVRYVARVRTPSPEGAQNVVTLFQGLLVPVSIPVSPVQ